MTHRIVALAVSSFAVWMLSVMPLAAQGDDQARIEKGRQVVAQVCAACHTTIVRMVQAHKQSAEQWKDTIYFMISRGAQIMPDEIEPVTAYLAATSGRGRPGAGGTGQQGPRVQGEAILQRNCQQCHELATATKKPDSQDWNAVVARMTTYGARLAPADREKLIEYLNGLKK